MSASVSPDGTQLAYWRTNSAADTTDLQLFTIVAPSNQRRVLSIDADSRGGAIVWSNDGQGLLFATYSREAVGPFGAPVRYELFMVDLAESRPRSRAAGPQVSGGSVYVPVGWDRSGKAAAAVITGEGGVVTEYATWNGNAANEFAQVSVPTAVLAHRIHTSTDARLVLGIDTNLNTLRVWPLLDPTKSETIRSEGPITSAVWRPHSVSPYEIIWSSGRDIHITGYPTKSTSRLYRSSEDIAGLAVRPDGSVVLVVHEGGRLSIVEIPGAVAVDLPTRIASAPLPQGVLLR